MNPPLRGSCDHASLIKHTKIKRTKELRPAGTPKDRSPASRSSPWISCCESLAAHRFVVLAFLCKPVTLHAIPFCVVTVIRSFSLVVRVPSCVLHVAPGLLSFALDLLCRSFNLSLGVARPLAHLALRASGCIVHSALYRVLVHSIFPPWVIDFSFVPERAGLLQLDFAFNSECRQISLEIRPPACAPLPTGVSIQRPPAQEASE